MLKGNIHCRNRSLFASYYIQSRNKMKELCRRNEAKVCAILSLTPFFWIEINVVNLNKLQRQRNSQPSQEYVMYLTYCQLDIQSYGVGLKTVVYNPTKLLFAACCGKVILQQILDGILKDGHHSFWQMRRIGSYLMFGVIWGWGMQNSFERKWTG